MFDKLTKRQARRLWRLMDQSSLVLCRAAATAYMRGDVEAYRMRLEAMRDALDIRSDVRPLCQWRRLMDAGERTGLA